MSAVTGRYAPSPSGRMHLGNLCCCLLAWLSAKSKGGRVVLRIEDLDTMRCPRSFADLLESDLAWLGISADEGGSAGGAHGPYYQSERSAIYQHYYDILDRRGLVYPCFCSRSQLHAADAPHRSDGQVVYPGTCRDLTPEQIAARARPRPPAWRVRVPDEEIAFMDGHLGPYRENLAQDCGDFYLRRADGVFAYQLAVVVDDALMGVTEVVRGADLLSSTPRQLWLYGELGLKAPEFIHMPLLLASDGRRLSKRDGDVSLETLKARYTPEEIIGRLGYLCGLQSAPDPRTPAELADGFSWDRVPQEDILLPDGLF
ncbi:MAG: tRNA glutamyl-Q(34) synthetase GluQRS [Oscillospiraceae bacterium]|nr:tRNA glutamyl-Q(34) synthetase GluQRS [Oscillospiraceae bacterium]